MYAALFKVLGMKPAELAYLPFTFVCHHHSTALNPECIWFIYHNFLTTAMRNCDMFKAVNTVVD